jgi:hypothetical protein
MNNIRRLVDSLTPILADELADLLASQPEAASEAAAMCRATNRRRKRPRTVDGALQAVKDYVSRTDDATAADLARAFESPADIIAACRAAVQREEDAQLALDLRAMPLDLLLSKERGGAIDEEIAARESRRLQRVAHVATALQAAQNMRAKYTAYNTQVVTPPHPRIPSKLGATPLHPDEDAADRAAEVDAFSAFVRGRWRQPDSRDWVDEVTMSDFVTSFYAGRVGFVEVIVDLPWSVADPYGVDGLDRWLGSVSKLLRSESESESESKAHIVAKASQAVRELVGTFRPVNASTTYTKRSVDHPSFRLVRWSEADEAIREGVCMLSVNPHLIDPALRNCVDALWQAGNARIICALAAIADASELAPSTVDQLSGLRFSSEVVTRALLTFGVPEE